VVYLLAVPHYEAALDLALHVGEHLFVVEVLVVERTEGVEAPVVLLDLVGVAFGAVQGRDHDGDPFVVVPEGVGVGRVGLVAVDAGHVLLGVPAVPPVGDDAGHDLRVLVAGDTGIGGAIGTGLL
jgi:hypothetical protein